VIPRNDMKVQRRRRSGWNGKSESGSFMVMEPQRHRPHPYTRVQKMRRSGWRGSKERLYSTREMKRSVGRVTQTRRMERPLLPTKTSCLACTCVPNVYQISDTWHCLRAARLGQFALCSFSFASSDGSLTMEPFQAKLVAATTGATLTAITSLYLPSSLCFVNV
jgi:hypothetical protein